jgi:FkbM family methyltransferase
MKLNLRQIIWCFLFKIKYMRILIFYNLKRYKEKLRSLDKLNLNKNSIVFDIGANNGVVSQYLFDRYSCTIHLFEPHPYCYEVLKNIFQNNYKIKIYNNAISDTSENKKLFCSSRTNDIKDMSMTEVSSLEQHKENVSQENFKITKCISIDEFINKFNFIDFIKIDIEGHEYKIIPSLIKNINKINLIFCEMHGENHHSEFREDFEFWDKKLIDLKATKFKYW